MTREQVIKALKWFEEYNEEDYCGGDRIQDEHGDWYYRITEQDFEAFEMAIKALEQEPRWIPVSERLPRKEGDYLVTVRNKEYGSQYIDITTYEHSEWGYKDEWQVIAWMNAPSEYKAESEDKYGNI